MDSCSGGWSGLVDEAGLFDVDDAKNLLGLLEKRAAFGRAVSAETTGPRPKVTEEAPMLAARFLLCIAFNLAESVWGIDHGLHYRWRLHAQQR